MGFLWPSLLLLLILIPLLIFGYIWVLRRRGRQAVRYSSLSLIRAARPGDETATRAGPVDLTGYEALR